MTDSQANIPEAILAQAIRKTAESPNTEENLRISAEGLLKPAFQQLGILQLCYGRHIRRPVLTVPGWSYLGGLHYD